MTVEREGLLEESVLRRALRLDPGELPPRLDPVTLAATARAEDRRRGEVVGIAAIAFVAGWAASEITRAALGALLAATEIDILGGAIAVVATVAVWASAVVDAVTMPTVPIAILAAVVLAIAFERSQRKGAGHVSSS